MKRKVLILLTAAAMTINSIGYADNVVDTTSPASLDHQHYANVPGMPTQEAVLEDTITYFAETDAALTYPVTVLEPDELIVDTLTDIVDFVQEQDVMPVRYFPEEVQHEVQHILGGASFDVVDILHMTEFFGIVPDFQPVEGEDAQSRVQLDADYTPGQLVVVMFGDVSQADTEHLTQEDIRKIEWSPLPADVTANGQISFLAPEELLQRLAGQECLFLVLTVRPGGSGTLTDDQEAVAVQDFVPSKDAGDLLSEYGQITQADGTPLPDDFRIFIRAHTDLTLNEIQRLQAFMQQDNQPIAAYFSEDLQSQMALLLENIQPDSLICYNANFLGAENYVKTYGDAIAGFRFATLYPDGTQVLCLLGTLKSPLPQEQRTLSILPEESAFDWFVLRSEAKDGYVWITFPQQLIPIMEQEGALALILSQPITGEEEPVT